VKRALVQSAALVCACTALGFGQNPRFSSGTESVRVDVLVTDAGRPIRGLQAPDFEIRDNGVLQQVDLVSFAQLPLNVVLALDMSSSLEGERLTHLKDAALAVVDELTKDDRASLLSFSHAVSAHNRLTADLSQVRATIARSVANGQTALVDGAFTGIMLGESEIGRGLLILFSDGVDTSSWLRPDAVLDIARRTDVVVYAVATEESLRSPFLQDLTSLTGGTLLESELTTRLRATFVKVLDEFRHRYLVTYSPRGVPKGGWHRIEVRVKGRRAVVKARRGYLSGS
jgi:Ca-activated chloride channel family protein